MTLPDKIRVAHHDRIEPLFTDTHSGHLKPVYLNAAWLKKFKFQPVKTDFAWETWEFNGFTVQANAISSEVIHYFEPTNTINLLCVHELQNAYFKEKGQEIYDYVV